MLSSLAIADDLSRALGDERPRLVRLCHRLTGNSDVAEDLAQETLLEGWRLRDRLCDPAGLSAWLSAIARNVCLRWQRASGHERERLAPVILTAAGDEAGVAAPPDALAAETDDPLAQVERAEVVALLSQALAALPETTRALTFASATRSTADLASAYGLSEGAVRVRVHRGRQLVRRALSGDLRAEAEALDLVLPEASAWLDSRIWCPFCGSSHLRYQVDRATGEYAFHCAGGCAGHAVAGRAADRQLVTQVSSPKSLLTRHCLLLATAYRKALAGDAPRCDCGAPVSFTRWTPEVAPDNAPYGIFGSCPTCGLVDSSTAWHLALDTTEAQRFWRRFPRMRALPMTLIERDNRPAIVTGFDAVDSGARLEIVSDASSYALLHVATTDAL